MKKFTLSPGQLTLASLRQLTYDKFTLVLNKSARAAIKMSTQVVEDVLASGKTVYGINTGFGILANTRISADKLRELQRSLVLSHATGTGELLAG